MTCAEGALAQCITQAYAAGGGQYDANGIPNGKGYVPPVLSPAPDPAAGRRRPRQARKQATANLEYDLKTAVRENRHDKLAGQPPAGDFFKAVGDFFTSTVDAVGECRLRVQASTNSTFKVPSIPGRTRRSA